MGAACGCGDQLASGLGGNAVSAEPYFHEERTIVKLQGQLAVFRGLANECLTLISTIEPECESEAYELSLLTQKLEAAVDGSTVCPLFN